MPQHAIISGTDDDETARLLGEHRRQHPDEPVVAVFEDDGVANLWTGDKSLTAVAWLPTLVRTALASVPPHPREHVSPPPFVVGDSRVADRIAAEIESAWSDPTQAVIPHRIRAAEAPRPTGPLGSSDLRPARVVEEILGLVAGWQAPPAERGTPTGPTVYIAAAPESAAVATARAITQEVEGARVVVVTSGEVAWPLGGIYEAPIQVAQRHVAVETHPGRIPSHWFARLPLLARLLFDDVAWLSAPGAEATRPEAPLFPTIRYVEGRARWDDQPESVTAPFLRLAAAIPELLELETLRLDVTSRRLPQQVVLTPGELGTVADRLLQHLEVEPTDGARLTALELAAQFPLLAARAGYAPVRPAGHSPLLTPELVDRLAPQVHLAYQGVGAATNNASSSPLARMLWDELTPFAKASNRATIVGCATAHAAVALDWRYSERPEPVNLAESDLLKRLGELEHRRWALNERRNGRGDHKWAQPWGSLHENLKQYDLDIAAQLPHILADANIEVFDARRNP